MAETGKKINSDATVSGWRVRYKGAYNTAHIEGFSPQTGIFMSIHLNFLVVCSLLVDD